MAANAIVPTIKDQVYAILKAEICGGVHRDGQRLHENELATRLKVSRSPVREALRQLASDGLVLELPNKGVFVKELTPEDIEDIFEVRLLLESYAIRRSPGRMSPEIAQELQRCHEEFAALHAADDITNYLDVDGRLHHALVRLSGNGVAISVYDKISSLAQKFRVISLLGKQRFDESVEEHQGVISHVLKGETEAAIQWNELHLQRAKQKIIEYLTSSARHSQE
ncbi:GntR family transcriptional regulator [Desulfovibrio sp. OttesenSCG-928-O18]|nr:GntR family transcriptional regulator [Desulfovibrio sp. OttesenSCG-928-O18]